MNKLSLISYLKLIYNPKHYIIQKTYIYIYMYNYQFQIWTRKMKLKIINNGLSYRELFIFHEIHTFKSSSTANEFNISDISI